MAFARKVLLKVAFLVINAALCRDEQTLFTEEHVEIRIHNAVVVFR